MLGSGNEIQLVVTAKDEATGTLSKVRGEIALMSGSLSGVKSAVGSFGSYFGTELGLISKAASLATVGVMGLTGTAAAITIFGLKTAGDLESAEMGFKTLLGSADKARDIMNRIKKEAAATPFTIGGLTENTQALTAITKDGDKAVDILLNVGKAVAASGKGNVELDRMVINLQQIGATGKITARDVMEMQRAVPIFNDIIKANGLTVDAIQNSDNAFNLLVESFAKSAQLGGLTYSGFIDQAGTFNQLLSNVYDSATILSSEIVKQSGLFSMSKDAMAGLIEWVDKNKDAIVGWVREGVEIARVKVQEWVQSVGGKEGIKQKLMEMWSTLVNDVIPAISSFIGVIGSIIGFIFDHKEGVIFLVKAYESVKLMLWAGGVIDAIGKFSSAIFGATGAVGGGSSGLIGSLVSPTGLVMALLAVDALIINETIKAYKDLQSTLENCTKNGVKQLDSAIQNAKKTMDDPNTSQKLRDNLRKATEEMQKNKDEVDKLEKRYSGAFGVMNALVDDLIGGWKRLGSKIAEVIKDAISGGKEVEGSGGKLIKRQFGGEITSGTPYLVGEHRPEVFVPHQSGSVKQLSQAGGGKEITINFNNVSVRNDADLDDIISRMKKVLSKEQEFYQIGAL